MDKDRIVCLNGELVPAERAQVSIFDRGFLMADAVYEVVSVLDGRLLDFDGHMQRLDRSLDAMDMPRPEALGRVLDICRELVRANAITDGLVYMQVSRGAAGERDFEYPDPQQVAPTLAMFAQSMPGLADTAAARSGIKVLSIPDIRWGRRDIKTVQLLYPSMGKMIAKRAGCDDAWMVEDGVVTEGTSNNAFIVKDGRIVTRELSSGILHGITRAAVLRMAREAQMQVEERPFTVAEAQEADEAFITSASAFVTPVVQIDGVAVGAGTPGPVARRLREIYLDECRASAI